MGTLLENRLCDIIESNPKTMSFLRRMETLGLKEWALSGGAIRNEVWSNLHNYSPATYIKDYDITYSGNADLFMEHEGTPVEYSDISEVHSWYLNNRGVVVPPFKSLEDTCAFWPEICSCVCVYTVNGDFKVVAPHGLEDLFEMVCRPNPIRFLEDKFPLGDYLFRVHKMGVRSKYPKVKIYTDL